MSVRLRPAPLLLAALIAGASAPTFAQSASPPPSGALPEATFELQFRKYSPLVDNAFTPFASWDAHLRLDAVVFRGRAMFVTAPAMIQTIGTEPFGAQVGVAATGYLLGVNVGRVVAHGWSVSGGVMHLSSHLTRDLDAKISEERGEGAPVPVVSDASQYNVLFAEARGVASGLPFTPELDLVVQPVDVRLGHGHGADVRPVFIATGWTLWRRDRRGLRVETEHELGRNSFNNAAIVLELYDRRLALFAGISPGHTVHISPRVAGLRDGIAFGFRLRFRGVQ